jgi:hypothetical protein
MREALLAYIKLVKDLADLVKGNEAATKQSLIGPLFTMLGYNLADPRECVPEYKADFGKRRSAKPVDWAFLQNGLPTFYVEAKDAGKKLVGYNEQLADYFAKPPAVKAKLGILTTGVQWWFFTDVVADNVMDKEPFLKWDVVNDEQPPYDFLTLLQKSNFKPELIKTFAQGRRHQNLLVKELTRLLEPSPEFTKLAIENLETRSLTTKVVDSWKPVLANAIGEWAKQRTLSSMLNAPIEPTNDSRVETTQEELDAYAIVARVLGAERKVEHEDMSSYFKVHHPKQRTWVVCRLILGGKRPIVWVPLPSERVQSLLPSFAVTAQNEEWSSISISAIADIESLAEVLRAAWDKVLAARKSGSESPPPDA